MSPIGVIVINRHRKVETVPKYTLQEGSDKPQRKQYALIPEGTVLNAEIMKIEEKVLPFTDDDGNPIKKVEFSFLVTDEKYSNRRLWGQTSTKFVDNPNCKLRSWTCELMGLDTIPNDFTLDTDQLVGLPCRVTVGHRTVKGKDGEEDTQREFVADVIRVRSHAPSASSIF